MSCCCPHSRSAGRFFSFFARRYRKRFESRGFEPPQKLLLKGLQQAGYQGASLLEIGSGVGHLNQSLLEQGASTAVGIDLAPKMIEEAVKWASDRGLEDRTRYIEGDFMEIVQSVEQADVTLLDKVVCCYPDADGLVHKTLEKTRRVYALIYPRNRWFIRAGCRLLSVLMKLTGSEFRPYVHDPDQVDQWVRDAGFTRLYNDQTMIWLVQVYVKDDVTS